MIRRDLQELPSYVPGRSDEQAIKLSSNESGHPPLPSVVAAMQAAATNANRYPDMAAVQLREALAQRLGLKRENIAVGTGSSALCQQLVNVTCLPGDEVVFPWRSFEGYPIFARIAGARPVPVPLDPEHRVSLRSMAEAITPKTRLIFVCNPNNPTGTTVSRHDFDEFMRFVPADVVVALDEAYVEYNLASESPVATDYLGEHPNLVGLRTFSKAYSLSGVRVGYAFGAASLIAALNKVAVPFSVSSVAQAGALASLAAEAELGERVEATIRERRRLAEALLGDGAVRSEANFVWLPAETLAHRGTPQQVAEQLADRGVLVRAFPEGIRITVTVAEEMDALLAAWG